MITSYTVFILAHFQKKRRRRRKSKDIYFSTRRACVCSRRSTLLACNLQTRLGKFDSLSLSLSLLYYLFYFSLPKWRSLYRIVRQKSRKVLETYSLATKTILLFFSYYSLGFFFFSLSLYNSKNINVTTFRLPELLPIPIISFGIYSW